MKLTQYQNAHEFLKESWRLKQQKNPSFSLRSWAKQMGMGSHTPLTLMINGKRPISKKYVPALIKSLQLKPREGMYLETLIEYNQCKNQTQKELYHSRLQDLEPREALPMVEVDTFKYLENPLHCILLDMTDLADFSPDTKWIQSKLRKKYSLKEIEETLERLIKLGLAKVDDKGKFSKTFRTITSTPDVMNEGVQAYHQNVSRLAAELIGTQNVVEREFNAYSMSIKKADLPKAKELIREFSKNFMNQIEVKSEVGEETYQLNVQFFALTENLENTTNPTPIKNKEIKS